MSLFIVVSEKFLHTFTYCCHLVLYIRPIYFVKDIWGGWGWGGGNILVLHSNVSRVMDKMIISLFTVYDYEVVACTSCR